MGVAAVLAQVVGCLLVCVAVGMLAGVWWAALAGGVLLLAGGMLAETAETQPGRPAPSRDGVG